MEGRFSPIEAKGRLTSRPFHFKNFLVFKRSVIAKAKLAHMPPCRFHARRDRYVCAHGARRTMGRARGQTMPRRPHRGGRRERNQKANSRHKKRSRPKKACHRIFHSTLSPSRKTSAPATAIAQSLSRTRKQPEPSQAQSLSTRPRKRGAMKRRGMDQLGGDATALAAHFRCLVVLVHHTPVADDDCLRGKNSLLGGWRLRARVGCRLQRCRSLFEKPSTRPSE